MDVSLMEESGFGVYFSFMQLFLSIYGGRCQLFYFYVHGSKEQGHKWTQPIKYGKYKILPHPNAQYPGMICTTGIPRDKDRGYGPGILEGPAKILGGKSPILICF